MESSLVGPETTRLEERVELLVVGPWAALSAPTPVESVVSFRGSFCTYPDFEAHESVLQELVVALLDKGTRKRDRFQIAEVLDDRGAHLSILSDGFRVRFSGKALPADVATVMDVLAEQLREPLFDPDEFEKTRAFVSAAYRREMESTAAQSTSALSRLLYLPRHPNHSMRPEEALERLGSLSLSDVVAYHAEHFAPSEAIIVFSGDLDRVPVAQIVADTVAAQAPAPAADATAYDGILSIPASDHVILSDKTNADVRIGHPLRLLRQDDDYLPLYAGNYVLGGNFSARLMAHIRDRLGLTYGIWSSLTGITNVHSGHWIVGVTLSMENIERGIESTRAEMDRFVEEGITDDELAEKQTTITGSFKVGLATTGGLAATLLHNAERGFDVGYLDRFPSHIEALDVETVNRAIRSHLDPSNLSLAIAGPDAVPVG